MTAGVIAHNTRKRNCVLCCAVLCAPSLNRCRNRCCRFGGATFMAFEDLTLVPIQTKMLEPTLLTGDEEAWLDA